MDSKYTLLPLFEEQVGLCVESHGTRPTSKTIHSRDLFKGVSKGRVVYRLVLESDGDNQFDLAEMLVVPNVCVCFRTPGWADLRTVWERETSGACWELWSRY